MAQSTASAPDSRTGYNGTGSTIANGTILTAVAGGRYRQVAPMSAIAGVIYGVAAEDIGNGEYGLVYVGGTVPVLASAALTVGARVTSTTAGLAATGVASASILGIALEVGAASTLAEVELLGPGSGLTPA